MKLRELLSEEWRTKYKRSTEQRVAEGLDEIDHADALDSSATSPNDLMQSGKVIGDIEGNDIVMISKGNQTVYILKVDDQATAFIGFEGKNLKNIKNFTETPGVIRALIGYLVHKKNMKIVVSPNEPLTLDGLKWITKLIMDPRGLVIKDHAGQDIDPIQLKQEWQTAKKTGTPGTTGITISENIQFGNKIRQSELKRNTDSLLMPFNFYSVKTKKQSVAEDSDECPPATQNIELNLENRQKAIDEYGYGPLNPDLPNTKFWMKKVDEWNLDSVNEAKQSLCGNCAAFDITEKILDCIDKGIGQGNDWDIIEAGKLGYCRFLKFKCNALRTCSSWLEGGPITNK
jgi:hypothetical protein